MKEHIMYHVAPVGTISSTLHDESAQIFRFLNLHREIDRFQRVDQLGIVRLAWPGARHPRWEYIVLIFGLVDRCSKVPGIHLSADITLQNGYSVSSGSELLKSWALLLQVGHLDGTFATERALLLALRNKPYQIDKLLDVFTDDPPLYKWAEDVIRKGSVRSFYQVLAFVRLHYLSSSSTAPLQIPWKAILRAYVLPGKERRKVRELKHLFTQVRRLAYLTLDTHYTPSVATIDLFRILSDPGITHNLFVRRYIRELDPLATVESYLHYNVYLAAPVLQEVARRETAVRCRIEDELTRTGLESTINELAWGDQKLSYVNSIDPPQLETVLRLRLRLVGHNRDILEQQEHFSNKMKDCDAKIVVWDSPNGLSWIIQAHAPRGDDRSWARAYSVCWDFLRGPSRPWTVGGLSQFDKREWQLFRLRAEDDIAVELILAVLNKLCHPRLSIRWEWDDRQDVPRAVFMPVEKARAVIEYLLEQGIHSGDSEAAELQAKMDLLGSERIDDNEYVAISIAHLTGYDQNNQQFCELDGCLIRIVDDRRIKVIIVEAKQVKDGGIGAARRQLRNCLRRLTEKNHEIQAKYVGRTAVARADLYLPA